MKGWIKGAVAALTAIGLGGGFVAVSGAYPMKASSGHWAVTRWFLEFGKTRSVSTWSMEAPEAPNLDDPALVLMGAGHFESGCAFCHGSPGDPQPPVPSYMLPEPPSLSEDVLEWQRDELFFIVKHGLKFTGMPAWPTQHRDDEVWAMVAFLERLPDLDEAGYEALVHGTESAEEVPDAVAGCVRCHGGDGLGRGEGAFPRLAGQSEAYLRASLDAYAEGDRHSGIMQPIAVRMPEAARDEAARWYAGRGPRPPIAVDAEAAARGELIARDGIRSQRVPPCAQCHGPGEGPRNDHYPQLTGQWPRYLETQLELFDAGKRGGTAYADVMETAAHELEPEQIRDVAAWYAGAE